MNNNTVVIVEAKRTAIGAFQGCFSEVSAPKLAASVIADILNGSNIDKNLISEVIMGCVLPAGLGQAPARQAALYAGLPNTIPCTTVNKMCGSGLKTIVQAYNNILVDNNKIILAGGMENMSRAPYLLPNARSGYRLGHGKIIDHMFYDGLEDVYTPGLLMGHFAERTAEKYNFTRAYQDEFAIESATRAQNAVANNVFKNEISAIKLQTRKEEIVIETDETPSKINLDKITKLKPVFLEPNSNKKLDDCTVTAANSSSISDGASVLLLMSQERANSLGLNPIAKIQGYTDVAQEPEWFTTAPVKAIKNLLDKINKTANDIDLYEINEAFAVVTMAAMHDLKLSNDKVNINGGACALGHPIGATGARIVTTLVHSLRAKNKHSGIASLCIGGGEALALAVELL